MTTNERTVGRYLRWLLAAFSAGAGAIHFAVAGEHFTLTWYHGVFFVVLAWLQLSWSAAVVIRPTQRLLALAAVFNAAAIGVWAVARLWGTPFGPEAWEPEPVALADALATAFEGAIVLTCLAVLVRPALATHRVRPAIALPGVVIISLAVAVVSSMSLTPSFAADHSGHTEGGHSAQGAGGHQEGHTDVVIAADGSSACEQSGYGNEGNSGHGGRGPVPFTPLDDETRAVFAEQVAQAEAVVAKYPTVADAEAGGYHKVTPYVPCIAAHYINNGALTNPFDPSQPEILLYDGTAPDSKIVGLSYLQFADKDKAPEGFAGDNDPWHVHRSLCLGGGGVLGDETVSDEECEARGGHNVDLENLWMTHMWPVPGWESRWGLFSSEHPDLGGHLGDINGEPQPNGGVK